MKARHTENNDNTRSRSITVKSSASLLHLKENGGQLQFATSELLIFFTLPSVKQLTIFGGHWFLKKWLKRGKSLRAKTLMSKMTPCYASPWTVGEIRRIWRSASNKFNKGPSASGSNLVLMAGIDHGWGIAYNCLQSSLMFPNIVF